MVADQKSKYDMCRILVDRVSLDLNPKNNSNFRDAVGNLLCVMSLNLGRADHPSVTAFNQAEQYLQTYIGLILRNERFSIDETQLGINLTPKIHSKDLGSRIRDARGDYWLS